MGGYRKTLPTDGGVQEMSNSARKVPRQCPLVLLSTEKF
jgi:hypothetical protein